MHSFVQAFGWGQSKSRWPLGGRFLYVLSRKLELAVNLIGQTRLFAGVDCDCCGGGYIILIPEDKEVRVRKTVEVGDSTGISSLSKHESHGWAGGPDDEQTGVSWNNGLDQCISRTSGRLSMIDAASSACCDDIYCNLLVAYQIGRRRPIRSRSQTRAARPKCRKAVSHDLKHCFPGFRYFSVLRDGRPLESRGHFGKEIRRSLNLGL